MPEAEEGARHFTGTRRRGRGTRGLPGGTFSTTCSTEISLDFITIPFRFLRDFSRK